jgi:hypothetical protein
MRNTRVTALALVSLRDSITLGHSWNYEKYKFCNLFSPACHNSRVIAFGEPKPSKGVSVGAKRGSEEF